MNPLRTIQVVNVRWFNATSWYALTLSKLLADAGHPPLVLTLADTETDARAREMGLEVRNLPLNANNPLRLAALTAQLTRLVREEKPAVVNCHRGESFFLWGLLKHFGLNYKLVRTRGDQRPPKSDFFNRWLHNKVADAVVVTNRAMARHFRDKMRTRDDHLWLILGGVDTDKFRFDARGRADVRREFGFGDKDFVIGLVGRFDKVKGQKELISAVGKLYHDLGRRNVRLLLIGFETATSQSQVEYWIDEHNIREISHISGRRNDVNALMSALDCGVVASLYSETIARAALELMSCGVPVVSTDVGVMPDLVCDEALVGAGDVPDMTLRLNEALKYPEFRERLMARQKTTLSQLTLQEFMRRTLALYQGLFDVSES